MKTVLVVDDSRIMRNIVKNTFDLLKIPVQYMEAEDGEKALGILKTNKIDLILLDWNMPNLSGIDFLKQIKSMDEFKEIPIIMVTSEAAKLNVIEAVKAGVAGYITKPINDKKFKEILSRVSF